MLLMVKKGIRGRICHTIHWYGKVITNIWKIVIKIKTHHILNIVRYGWEMWQKLPVNNFESIEDTSQFNEDFMKS